MKTVMFSYMTLGRIFCHTITPDQLMDAIAAVGSGRGETSANIYQLTEGYVADVARLTGQSITLAQATASSELARCCIEAYWEHYGERYWMITGRRAGAETLARIHHGGPDGWRKQETLHYWFKVKRKLVKSGKWKVKSEK